MSKWTGLAMAGAAAMLTACGGGGEGPDLGVSTKIGMSEARGSLKHNPPPRLTALSAAELQGRLAASPDGQSLLALAGTPKCGVNIHYIEYGTVGGAGEKTNASGALMVPAGDAPGCGGPRPVVLYAHGTTTDRAYNIADITESSRPGADEGTLLAAMYAAQGFIVVAPNYAGYGVSTLNYHPYLNADQQSKDMMDALTAARTALPAVGGRDGGKLLITGYSQGGHVAMATHRALQAAGQPVTAAAPMSGPYALGAFSDAVYYGNVGLGSTVFSTLLATSYQRAYGNIYNKPSDIFERAYAPGIESLLPSNKPIDKIFAQGKLPQTQLFSSTPPAPVFAGITPPTQPPEQAPLFALGFGVNDLLKNSARLAYLQDAIAHPDGAVPSVTTGGQAVAPQFPLRQALKTNDLRNWAPRRPVLLCGGHADPTVFYGINTTLMQGLWSAPSPLALPPGRLTVLDVDSASGGAADPFAAVKAGFAQAKAGVAAQGGADAVAQAYHGTLVPPFCNVAARAFFQQVLASGG